MICLRTEPILPITRMSTIRGADAFVNRQSNRKTAQEAAEEATAYDANNLNQYTAIQEGTAEAFVPTFDADGNQTKVKTSTGIWNVVYNAENRPVTFTSEDGSTVVECTYDYMGRRHTRKITVNGSVTNYLRYIYRDYLQIAAINVVSGVFQWFILWDPTQPVATRPLGIRKDGTWYVYGWDLTKNICEVFGSDGYIKTAYTYTPYGSVTANGNVTQPIQWSSEYNDTELGLVYYNYRHYNTQNGDWLSRDVSASDGYNLYLYIRNRPIDRWDAYGLFLDFLKNSDGELPTSTHEVSSPVPVWGGYPFGSVEIGMPKNGKQEVTFAVGINWNARKLFEMLKKLPLAKIADKLTTKIEDKLPKAEAAVYIEGKSSYSCGCFSSCEVSLGIAITLGSGRRGGTSSSHKNLQGLDTQYKAVAGFSGELKGTADLCKGIMNASGAFVITMGISAPGFSIFGYGFNPAFEFNYTEEGETGDVYVPALAVLRPCA